MHALLAAGGIAFPPHLLASSLAVSSSMVHVTVVAQWSLDSMVPATGGDVARVAAFQRE